jgi:hypothetical protein
MVAMAHIQKTDLMTVLDWPAIYLLLPAVLMLVWLYAKEMRWPALIAGSKVAKILS